MGFNYQAFLKHVSTRPGVYLMKNQAGTILYVGKAANLKNRLSSYFRKQLGSTKTVVLMRQVSEIETLITHSETEALILEQTLIKKHQPRYNILMRDDKSYPYLHLTDEAFPRLMFYRGKKRGGHYFGPYPNAYAAKETLEMLSKMFLIRQCSNAFFNQRTRPCLEYEIKRCSAPCVGLASQEDYQQQINEAVLFLEGKSETLFSQLETAMQAASDALQFEQAAALRDKLFALRKTTEKQHVDANAGDADVLALAIEGVHFLLHIFCYRNGRLLSATPYFEKNDLGLPAKALLQTLIAQHYFDSAPPRDLLLSTMPADVALLVDFFQEKHARTVRFIDKPRGERLAWLKLAKDNAQIALETALNKQSTRSEQFSALAKALGLARVPQTLACVDVSHTQGEATVASYVVSDWEGARKRDYRRFNIKGVQAGDDYAAMQQLLQRRFRGFATTDSGENHMISSSTDSGENRKPDNLPDVLFIDGGLGQFHAAEKTLASLGVSLFLVGIAKGAARKAGQERLIFYDAQNQLQEIKLGPTHPAMHLIQQVRDESHRFALLGHRKQRDKKRFSSSLSEIEGIGEKRKQSLLKYFAGLHGVKAASIEALSQAPGISPALAKRIYEHFHDN